ncbi:unnamed protein product [Blepharisma stoltei]|uniref:H/ACA ribonucleoprotein complex subunit n=1 Tax=Blepharisma stoltei TaxID=1481888 RepID=A0AAU9JDU4_9CILI|nr:unnamed protein product [Blepharisma stoltei]
MSDENQISSTLNDLLTKVEEQNTTPQADSKKEIIPDFNVLTLNYENEFIGGELRSFGTVLNYTEGFLVITPSPAAPLLELDTKICRNDGLVVGKVDDIFGSIEHPYYSLVAFQRMQAGEEVFYQSNAPILTSINRKKGTDASNKNDEETSEESSEEEVIPEIPHKKMFSILSKPPSLP